MTQHSFWSRKRLYAATAIAVAGAFVLAGCSSGGSPSASAAKEPQTITMAYATVGTKADPYKTLAQKYMKEHKGVTIKLDPLNLTTIGQTLTTELQAGNGPDLFQTEGGTGQNYSTITLAKAGLLGTITGSNDAATLLTGTKSLYDYKGKQVGVPLFNEPTGIVYNESAASAAGTTVASNLQATETNCKKAPAGKSLFVIAGSQSPNTGLIAQVLAASQVYGPDPNWNAQRAAGKVTFANSKGWQQTLQSIIDLSKAGCFQAGAAGAGFDAMTNGLSSGSSFAFFAPGGSAAQIMAQAPVKLLVQAMPAPKGKKTYLISGPSDALSINAKTKSPVLANDFLNWLMEPANAAQFASIAGELPIVDAGKAAVAAQFAPVETLLKNKQTILFPTTNWPNGEVYDALGSGVTGLLTGQATVKQVLQNMDAAWGN